MSVSLKLPIYFNERDISREGYDRTASLQVEQTDLSREELSAQISEIEGCLADIWKGKGSVASDYFHSNKKSVSLSSSCSDLEISKIIDEFQSLEATEETNEKINSFRWNLLEETFSPFRSEEKMKNSNEKFQTFCFGDENKIEFLVEALNAETLEESFGERISTFEDQKNIWKDKEELDQTNSETSEETLLEESLKSKYQSFLFDENEKKCFENVKSVEENWSFELDETFSKNQNNFWIKNGNELGLNTTTKNLYSENLFYHVLPDLNFNAPVFEPDADKKIDKLCNTHHVEWNPSLTKILGFGEMQTRFPFKNKNGYSGCKVGHFKKRGSEVDGDEEYIQDEFDIENGLVVPEITSKPFLKGRKLLRFYSKRTNRSTVISLIDPTQLTNEKFEEEGIGFLTFHDCVELRRLKTGESLTRNQRNNLRKRLASTALYIAQVDVPRVLQEYIDVEYHPRTFYHHTKLNTYLITAAVSQVLLCTREIENGVDAFKQQTVQTQTLFDLCKNENAGAALTEFIKSQKGISLDARDFKGMCPLHYAAKSGFYDVVKSLIDAGADVNVKDKSEQTPLHYAIYNGHKEIQFLLLSSSAKVDTCNISGNTLLHVAAYHNQNEVAREIIKRCPALKYFRNHKFNSTPLECASHKGLKEMVELLETAE